MGNGTLEEFNHSLKEISDRSKRCNCNKDHLVTISYEKLKRLLYRDKELLALEKNGVDNWEGYGDAMEDYRKSINDIE